MHDVPWGGAGYAMQAARRKTGEVPELAGEVWLVGERELGGDKAQGRCILGAYRPQRLLEPREPRVALQPEADLTTEQRAQRASVQRKPCGDGGNAVSLAQSALDTTDQLGGAGAGAVCPGNQGPFDTVEQQRHPRRRVGGSRTAGEPARQPVPVAAPQLRQRNAEVGQRVGGRTDKWPEAAGPEHHPDSGLPRYRLDQ